MSNKRFDTDVLVAGGGVAGCSAALTAARGGLRTMLLESQISLGGLATNGYVNGIAGMVEGNCAEWLNRLEAKGALIRRPHQSCIDPEKGKLVLEEMLLEAGVRILYGVYVIDTIVENGVIKGVICHGKSGKIQVDARFVVDATGDADIAAAAGAPYEVGGNQLAGYNMSTTLAFRMANVNMPEYQKAGTDWMQEQMKKAKVWPGMGMLAELEDKAVANGDRPQFIFPTALI